MDELIDLDLEAPERDFLRCGIMEWGGPARCTEELAVAMGFQSVSDLFAQSRRLIDAVISSEPMTRLDWWRVLVATEIVFASDVLGSGLEWSTTTGISDSDSISTLRRIQRKAISRGIRPDS